jgi:hypothetical protein
LVSFLELAPKELPAFHITPTFPKFQFAQFKLSSILFSGTEDDMLVSGFVGIEP